MSRAGGYPPGMIPVENIADWRGQEVVDPNEEALVVAIVVSMLRAGRLTWHRGAAALESAQSGHRPDTGAGRHRTLYSSVDDLLWEIVHTHHMPSE